YHSLGNLKEVERLISNGADPNAHYGKYDTFPLGIASRHGYLEIVKFLLEKGANVNEYNHEGYGPLAFAAGEGHEDIVRLLISKGADPNKVRNNGTTPMW